MATCFLRSRFVTSFTSRMRFASHSALKSCNNVSYRCLSGNSRLYTITTNNPRNGAVGRATSSFLEAQHFIGRPAIYDGFGLHKYDDILKKAEVLADRVKDALKLKELNNKKPICCLLCRNDSRYVISLWGAWLGRCVAVPLSGKQPEAMLGYFVDDCQADVLLYTKEFEDTAKRLSSQRANLLIHLVENLEDSFENDGTNSYFKKWEEIQESGDLWEEPGLVIYTSGTTGKPKGVLHTHGTLHAMVQGMRESWMWAPSDVIVHALPLNHVHGVVNALLTPLTSGALCIMLPKFEASQVWNLLLAPDDRIPRRPNVFMGVPTMYSMLMTSLESSASDVASKKTSASNVDVKSDAESTFGSSDEMSSDFVKEMCLKNVRLFVSGSAPLPLQVTTKWEQLTGHKLLERYGMTEVGMALTNPVAGSRLPGSVGLPFPFVEVAVAKKSGRSSGTYDILVRGDRDSSRILTGDHEKGGELLVRGATVFKEYLNKPAETKDAFTSDGWFITGDTACYDEDSNSYRILGRTSVDVIKSGGYKLSALEIENHISRHRLVKEVAVLGLPDPTWGQKVVALVVLQKNVHLEEDDASKVILDWCRGEMTSYQVPKAIKVLARLERNDMGKLNKKLLLREHFAVVET